MTWRLRFEEMFTEQGKGDASFRSAQLLKRENLPESLFKYCSADYFERTLQTLSGKLWLSDPRHFNDPLDCTASFDVDRLFAEVAESTDTSGKQSSLLVRMTRGEAPFGSETIRKGLVDGAKDLYGKATNLASTIATKKLRKNLGITCFADIATSAPMWAHYGSYHAGVCVEWERASWLAAPEHLERLFPVFYDERPFEMPSLVMAPQFERAELLLALRKASDWSYEREWRYVHRIPPGEKGRLFSLPSPSAVHLGFKIDRAHKKQLVSACRNLGVVVYQVRCASDRGYLKSERL